jgi:probable rRNA maturation factor
MIQIEIFNETKSRLPGKVLRELFALIEKSEAKRGWTGTVHLVFVHDRVIQRLNKAYRKLNKPTDVLSFNIDSPVSKDSVFGEVYISSDTAKRQAKQYGTTIIDEYLRLACHGFLHLFGHDHKKSDETTIMRKKEDRYLKAVIKS